MTATFCSPLIGDLLYGFEKPLNTAGPNSATVRCTKIVSRANAMYAIAKARLVVEIRIITSRTGYGGGMGVMIDRIEHGFGSGRLAVPARADHRLR